MKTTITTLIAAGACLAAAAPASASYYGSDLDVSHQASSISCQDYPCTVAQHHFADYGSAKLPPSGVITEWRLKLTAGSTATLVLMKGNDGYRALDVGPTVTGSAGVTSALTRIPLVNGAQLAGIELEDGSILTDHDDGPDGPSAMLFDGTLDPFSLRGVDDRASDELFSQVRVEPDVDDDGLGDESQDDCVGDCHATPGGQIAEHPSDLPQTGTVPGSSRLSDPYEAELAKRPPLKLTVDPRAFFDENRSKPIVSAYFSNEGRYPVKGSIRLLAGKKPVGGSYSIEQATDSSSSQSFLMPKKLAAKVRRGRKVKLTFVASLTAGNGTRSSVRRTVTVSDRGVTTKFDGTYAGTAGLKFTVTKGLLTSVTGDVRTFCPGSNKFLYRTLGTAEGFPAAVGRNGTFKVKGSFDKDTVSYSGALKRRGSASGKLSLFHTELTFGDGLGIDQCAGASNWTAKRGKRQPR